MKKFLLLALFSFSISAYAQTSILMGNGTNTVCSGQFESSIGFGAGQTGLPGYTASENYVMTFCPGVSGNLISMNFVACILASGDVLTVYNGNSTAAPIIGVYDMTNPLLGTISAITSTNPGGCLTFQFISDTGSVSNGWTASISCNIPCQAFEIGVDSLSPDTSLGGFIDMCDADTVFLSVTGDYFNNGLNYNQYDSTTTFYWYLDTTLFDSGAAINFPPDTTGAFLLQVYAIDSLGCDANYNLNFWIRVATEPDFSPSFVSSDTICFGDTAIVNYGANSVPWSNTDTMVSAPTTYLPDGSGSSPGVYTNTLTFSKFGTGDTIGSLADLDRVWVNMEHSFLGDLTISISCPNSSTSILKNFPGGGGRWLGEACDNNLTTTAGIGYYYEWLPTGNNLTDMVSHSGTCVGCPTVTNPCNTLQSGTTLQSDSYTPVQPLTNLIGCPLNGTWTLTIIDQWAIDNGYLFSWGIQLDSSLYPNSVISYDPGIDSVWITSFNTASVTTTYPDSLVVSPSIDDTSYCYTVDVLDGFGCYHDTTICFFVRDMCDPACYTPSSPTFTNKKVSCPAGSDGELYAAPNSLQMPGPWTYIWTDASGNVVSTTVSSLLPDTVTGLAQGGYNLEIIDGNGCSSTWQTTLGTINAMQVTVVGVGQTSCAAATCDAQASVVVYFGSSPYSYLWSSGDTTPVASTLCGGLNNVFITDANGCVDTSTFTVTTPAPIVTSSYGDTLICVSQSTNIGTNTVGGTPPYSYVWTSGGATTQVLNANPTVTQTFYVYVTDANNCTPDTGEVLVAVRPPLSVTFTNPDTLCPGDTAYLVSMGHGGDSAYSYVWEQGLGTTSAVPTVVAVSQYYAVTISDGCGSTPASDSVWLQVGGYPPLKVDVTPDDTICIGDVAYLYAQGIGGDKKFHYVWDNNLGTGPAKGVQPFGSNTYNVTVTDECLTPAGVGTINVTVGNFENFEAWVDTNKQCDPGTFVFGFDTLNPNFQYYMNFGNKYSLVDPFTKIERTFDEDGCHDIKVKLVSELGCMTEKKYPCFFKVLPKPIAEFDFRSHKPDVKEFSVDFWDESTGATTWNWFSNNSPISNDDAFSKFFPDTGTYNIKLIVKNEYGCSDTTDTDLPLAFVSSYYLPTGFTPNGDNVNDVFNLVGEGIQDKDFELIIYDRWGGEVLNITSRTEGWNGQVQNTGEMMGVGTYNYTITFRLHNGRKITEFGQVNLLR